jgi:hypothetical protein
VPTSQDRGHNQSLKRTLQLCKHGQNTTLTIKTESHPGAPQASVHRTQGLRTTLQPPSGGDVSYPSRRCERATAVYRCKHVTGRPEERPGLLKNDGSLRLRRINVTGLVHERARGRLGVELHGEVFYSLEGESQFRSL